jgi:hypothetical protein
VTGTQELTDGSLALGRVPVCGREPARGAYRHGANDAASRAIEMRWSSDAAIPQAKAIQLLAAHLQGLQRSRS